MKAIVSSVLTLGLLIGFNVSATPQDINEIVNLAEQVKYAARTTQASSSELQDVKYQLRDILATLNQTSNNPPNAPGGECFDFAFAKYNISQNSQSATDNAINACRQIEDLDVAQYLYEKYFVSMNSASAMDRAASRSGSNMTGKQDMLEFTYDKHFVSMNSASAADRAANQTATLRRGSLSCLQSLHAKYYQSMNSSSAMDAAIKGCQ